MLSRVYIDNFRSLVNFQLKLDPLTLLLGPNGSGKSSVFAVLRNLQRLLVDQEQANALFKYESLTRWQTLATQRFELEITLDEGRYDYLLALEHAPELRTCRIHEERLCWNDKPLYHYRDKNAHLYRDDHTEGPEYPFDWSRSGIAMLQPRRDNTLLTRFRQEIDHWVIVNILPSLIDNTSLREASRLDDHAGNFISLYRFLSQEQQGNILELTQRIREIIPGFDHFSLRERGEEARVMNVFMRTGLGNGKPLRYSFDELSDGQQMLIILYTLLVGLKDEGYSLFIDEPANFVSLREIQPWLLALQDACGSWIQQATLISHHPEILNLFAQSNGRWLHQQDNGPVQVKDAPLMDVEGLTPAEIIARGWDS